MNQYWFFSDLYNDLERLHIFRADGLSLIHNSCVLGIQKPRFLILEENVLSQQVITGSGCMVGSRDGQAAYISFSYLDYCNCRQRVLLLSS